MPELPEVEYTTRQLRAAIMGAIIRDAQVFWERTVGYPELPNFLAEIAERSILVVRRRGKYLILDLSGDLIVTIHRRMTGNLLLLPPGDEIDPVHLRYCRVCFTMVDGRRLLYTDPRKFGRIELWPREREEEALAGLGVEPLGDEFTVEGLERSLAGRKGAIKQVLLDQTVIAGLGNIYADEALYYAFIHPLRPAQSLSADEVRLLREGVVAVLTLGIEHGGTSFSEYRDLWGEAGDNYNHVRVYQQDGKPCARCGTLIERMVVGQRGTHYCPTCQKLTGA